MFPHGRDAFGHVVFLILSKKKIQIVYLLPSFAIKRQKQFRLKEKKR
jgi:hypothetical protein